MLRRSLLAIAAVLVTATGAATPALAQSANPSAAEIRTARELFAGAEKDEAAQQWAPALEKLQRAAAIKTTAGIRFHIALCEENLGRLLEAQKDYTAAEAQAKTDKNKEVLEAATEALAQLRIRIPTLRVVIPQGVSDAEVLVDKKAIAATDAGHVTSLEPGTHSLEVRAPGRQPYAKSIKVIEREITTVEPPLLPIAPPPGAPAVVTPPPQQVPAPMPVEKSEPPPSPEGRSRTLPIVFTAGAVGLVGLGFGAFVIAGSKQDDAKSACDQGACDDGARSSVRTWDALALGSWIGGAALGAAAIYLWAQPSRPSGSASLHDSPHVRLVPWGPGVRVEGSF